MGLATAVAVVVGELLVGGLPGLAAGSILGGVAWWWSARLRRSDEELVDAWFDLPFALELIAACLTAGLPPDAAAAAVADALDGPVGVRLGIVARASALGSPPGQAWQPLADVAGAASAVRSIGRSTNSGTDLARSLTRAADDLRAERRSVADRRTRRVGVLVVLPLGLCFLPAFVCVGIVPVVLALLGVVLR